MLVFIFLKVIEFVSCSMDRLLIDGLQVPMLVVLDLQELTNFLLGLFDLFL